SRQDRAAGGPHDRLSSTGDRLRARLRRPLDPHLRRCHRDRWRRGRRRHAAWKAARGRRGFTRCASLRGGAPGAAPTRRGRRPQRHRARAAVAGRRVPGLEGAASLPRPRRRSGHRGGGAAAGHAARAWRAGEAELRAGRRARVPAGSGTMTPRRERVDPVAWLALPAVIYLALVYALPLVMLLARGVMGPKGFTVEPLASFLSDPLNWQVIGNTLKIAALVTIVCLIIGYPTAFALAWSAGWAQIVLLAAIILPLSVGVVVKAFAWQIVLRRDGVL